MGFFPRQCGAGRFLGLEKWNQVELLELEDLLPFMYTSWEVCISHVQIPPPSTYPSHLLLTRDNSAIFCSPWIFTQPPPPLLMLLPVKSFLSTQPQDPVWSPPPPPRPAWASSCSLSEGIPAPPITHRRAHSPTFALPAICEIPTLGDNLANVGLASTGCNVHRIYPVGGRPTPVRP